MHPGIHSLTGSASEVETELTRDAIVAVGADARTAGILIHRLGDSYSHRMLGEGGMPYPGAEAWVYPPRKGHGRHLHTPDVIQRRPDLYLEYVDTLAATLGELRGLDKEQTVEIQRRLRADLKAVAVQAPSSGPRGLLKSDEVLEHEAQRELRRLLLSDLEKRNALGLEPTDLTYKPELSGPELTDTTDTTPEDLAITLATDHTFNRPRYYYPNRLSKTERAQFSAEAGAEAKHIEPSVLEALRQLELARDRRYDGSVSVRANEK